MMNRHRLAVIFLVIALVAGLLLAISSQEYRGIHAVAAPGATPNPAPAYFFYLPLVRK